MRIECDLPEIDVAVRGNRQRLKQVLLNLVSNAIKYSPKGSCVRVQIARTGDMLARIDVVDSGPGIPAEQLEKAFTPFERLGASARVEGTGLGLPVSRNLVQAMGGTIEVASSSAGSTFSVELPLAGGTAEPIRRVITPGSTNGNGRGHMNGHRRLLYIEDNLSNVELIERIVARHDDLVLEHVARGDTGVEAALREPPDAVVVDLHLPDMSGATVVQTLRSDPRTCTVPLIVVTADITHDHEEMLMAVGASAYLTKPLDLARFEAELQRAFARPRD
jgi:CheY-like chemotaxis protein